MGHRLQEDAPAYQQKLLRYAYVSGPQIESLECLVAAYDAATLERVAPEAVHKEQEVLAFWMACLPRYVDTLKRATVERFIDMTHRRYYESLKEYFGWPITHVYTDDLNSYLDRGASLPYTETLPGLFQKRFGYSLLDSLPKLVENLPLEGRRA